MKKSVTLLVLSIFILQFVIAQDTLPYGFKVLENTYADLENATLITADFWDDFDDLLFEFPIGFDFMLFDSTIQYLSIGNGFSELAYNENEGENTYSLIIPCDVDLVARINTEEQVISKLSYKLEGEPGSRIFKQEWKNVGFKNDYLGSSFINFQFWLYEATGNIEFHYGPSLFVLPVEILYDELPGPLIGLIDQLSFSGDEALKLGLFLSGSPEQPIFEVVYDIEGIIPPILLGHPTDGTVYCFSRNNVINSKQEGKITALQIFPTMVEDELQLKFKAFSSQKEYQITDMSGKIIIQKTILEDETMFLSHLQVGMYIINLFEDGKMQSVAKFIKR